MRREDQATFWDARYREGSARWDVGAAAPPLARLARTRRLLDGVEQVAFLGSGPGHDAIDWAEAGFHVMGFDFAESAVVEATQRAAQEGVEARCRFSQADIFELASSYAGVFDAVVEYTCFCAIHPDRRGEYRGVVEDLLRPGGLLVGLWFPSSDPGDGGPPYRVTRQDIDHLFLRGRDAFELVHEEEPADSIPRRRGRERFMILRKPEPKRRRGKGTRRR
jgi:SAM-dependent methyltransferase